jgi:Flp pilus assembly protein TadG
VTPPRPEAEDEGSVLLLFPAAVLIVIVLAAIAVDASIAFLGQREVANAAAAAANDAAGQGVSNRAFYEHDQVQLDAGTVERLVVERVHAVLDPARFHDLDVEVAVVPAVNPGCPPTVRVRATARVDYVFARAIPGGPDRVDVASTSVASPRQAGQPGC